MLLTAMKYTERGTQRQEKVFAIQPQRFGDSSKERKSKYILLVTAYQGTISKTFMENKDLQQMIFLSLYTQTTLKTKKCDYFRVTDI